LTVRAPTARLAAPARPSHPAPRVVTIAIRPLSERGTSSLNHNFCLSEIGIFLRDELDSSGKTGGEFSFARRTENTAGAGVFRPLVGQMILAVAYFEIGSPPRPTVTKPTPRIKRTKENRRMVAVEPIHSASPAHEVRNHKHVAQTMKPSAPSSADAPIQSAVILAIAIQALNLRPLSLTPPPASLWRASALPSSAPSPRFAGEG